MKKIPFLLLILIFVKTSIAQDFTKAIHTEYNIAEANIILHQNNLYFSTKTSPSAGTEKTDIYSFTKNGTFRFRKTLSLGASTNAAKVFATTDGKVAVAGYVIPDCHVANTLYPFLAKLDTNGLLLFVETYTNTNMNGEKIQDGCQLTNNDYYLIGDKRLIRINALGTFVANTNLMDSIFSLTTLYNQNSILINGFSNFVQPGHTMHVFGPNLNYVSGQPAVNSFMKIQKNKTRFFGITKQGYIEALDTSFVSLANTISSQNFNGGSRVQDFNIANDTLYAIVQHSNNAGSAIIRLDTNLTLINNYNQNSPYQKAQNICVYDTRAYLNLNHLVPYPVINNPGYSEIPYISLVSVPANTVYTLEHDIALSKIEVDNVFPVNTYTQGTMALVDLKFKATVKNNGSTTINSFYLTANRGSFAGDACYRKFIHQQFSNVNIAPGDSATVVTDTVIGLLQQPYFPNYTTINNLCFLLSAPNDENDNALLNNNLCPNISLPTNLTKNYLSEGNVVIYPNPANSTILIENSPANAEIRISDLLGKVHAFFKDSEELDVSGLPEGVYILQITSTEINTRAKVIIRR